MNTEHLCCDADRIERLLKDLLSDAEQAALEQHLNDCGDCRRRLETAAAGAEIWTGVRDSLATDDAVGLGACDSDQDLTSESSVAHYHSSLLGCLAPSDDERSLGRLGTYEVVGVIGSGGMGVVLKAFDAALDRYVAIKMMAPHLGGSGAARKRFAREARAAAAVVHDNVIEIHGVADAEGLPYLVMPYVRGLSLERRLDKQGPLAVVEILRIGMQAASGLAAAHAQGLIHRDVSPGNILLEDGVERVKLTDFGLARAADDASVTRSGVIAGTPQYMSPEQARGEALSAQSDLFSLGSVLYAICTGRPPFRAETSYGILRRITDEEPRPIREINSDIPEWLCRIIGRLMAKDPRQRFNSAAEVAEILERCLAHVQQPAAIPLPSIAAVPVQKPPHRRSGRFTRDDRTRIRKWFWIPLALVLLLAGVVVVLELNKGTLIIESNADDIPIRVMQGDVIAERLTVTRRGASVRIAAGRYVVEIDGETDGLVIEDNSVKLQRGGREIVRIAKTHERPSEGDTEHTQPRVGRHEQLNPPSERSDAKAYPGLPATRSQVALETMSDGTVVIRGSADDVQRIAEHIRMAEVADARSAPSPAPREMQPGRTKLRVLDSAGHPVGDNQVILGRQGYADAELPLLSATPSHRGVISLDKLTAGTHWLLVRGDPPAVLRLDLPAGEGTIVRSVPRGAGLIGRNLDAKISAEAVDDSEFIVVEIHNRTEEAVTVAETDLDLLTAIGDATADAHVLSPLWSQSADAPETTIRPGETATLRLNWHEWVRHGYWFSRDGEPMAEPSFPPPEPGTTWIRIAPFSALPVAVTHPTTVIAPAKIQAELDGVQRFTTAATGNEATVALSPDGKWIAISGHNPTRVLLQTGASRLEGEWQPIVEVLAADSGQSIVSLPLSSEVEQAAIAATDRITHIEASALAFSRDGKMLAVGTNIGQVKLYEAHTGKLLHALDDRAARLAEPAPEQWRSLPRAMGSVSALAFSPDGEHLAVCGKSFAEFAKVFDGAEHSGRSSTGSGRLKVWNLATERLEHDLAGHSHVEAVAFSADRGVLVSAGRWEDGGQSESGIIVWNPYSGTIICKQSIPSNGGARSVAVSPDSRLVAVASQNFDNANDTSTTTISLSYVLTGVVKWQQTVPGWARPVAFTPDGKHVLAICGGTLLRFFNVENSQVQHAIHLGNSSDRWTELAVAPQSDALAVGGVDTQRRCFINRLTLQPLIERDDSLAPAAENTELRFSETTEFVLSAGHLQFMVDLDTGESMDNPMTIGRPEQEKMDAHPSQVQPYQYPTGLTGLSLQGLEVKPSDWSVTATELREKLTGDAVAPLRQMDFDPAQQATYYFRTKDGTEGVLQILGLVEDPKGIRIRYKTIETFPSTPPR